jgi:hypothetical protein
MNTTPTKSISLHFREGASDKVYQAAIEPKDDGYVLLVGTDPIASSSLGRNGRRSKGAGKALESNDSIGEIRRNSSIELDSLVQVPLVY